MPGDDRKTLEQKSLAGKVPLNPSRPVSVVRRRLSPHHAVPHAYSGRRLAILRRLERRPRGFRLRLRLACSELAIPQPAKCWSFAMASGYLNNGDSSSPSGLRTRAGRACCPGRICGPTASSGFVVEDAEPLSAAPLRHADGRLTEAGWQAERDALAGSRQKEIEGTSFWDNLVAGYGRSLPNLYQGAKQAYVDSVAGLSGTAADVLGDIGGETLGDARRGVASYGRSVQRAATGDESGTSG
ncbi:hypothetical protein SNK04_014466 [Fusarium graminearum]